MSIKVIRNDAGNCVVFEGSTNPVYWNACLSGEVDSEKPATINVVNDVRTVTEGSTVYEFYQIPYTEFLDADGVSFSTAQGAADYITSQANVLGNTGVFLLGPDDTLDFTISPDGSTVLLNNGDSFGTYSIQATEGDGGTINIVTHTTGRSLYEGLLLSNAYIDGALVSQTLSDAVVELNTLFSSTGSSQNLAPSITSTLAVSIVEGETLNYELTADRAVGYEWSGLPSGVVTVNGNVRRLVGGTGLAQGTYNITAKAINYFGEDSETVVLTVEAPAFNDTKSVSFSSSDLAQASGDKPAVFDRSSNGSGASDEWTISFWIKTGTHSGGSKQTIIYAGGDDHDNEGHVWVYYKGSEQALYLEYGSKNNYLRLRTPTNVLSMSAWKHVLISYDGGTTGAASGSVNSYYGRFTVAVDGVIQTTTNSEGNYGWSSGLTTEAFQIGKRMGGNDYLRNGAKIDELALWGTDEAQDIANIYNGGSTQDLTSLSPTNWWRMGDGDSFPTLSDGPGTADLTMVNMTVAEIVSDVP